ncbi:MAG: hypothetical protein MJ181_11405 [Treponema sp.]|nr:hypothetical protein [Treponema sp.]
MVELNQVISGIKKYLENELVTKVTGINKWIVGASLSMVLDNGVKVFNELKELPIVKTMDIINSDDQIDIDKLYKALLEESKKSAVTFQFPLVGSITLKSEDVEKIYSYIKGN